MDAALQPLLLLLPMDVTTFALDGRRSKSRRGTARRTIVCHSSERGSRCTRKRCSSCFPCRRPLSLRAQNSDSAVEEEDRHPPPPPLPMPPPLRLAVAEPWPHLEASHPPPETTPLLERPPPQPRTRLSLLFASSPMPSEPFWLPLLPAPSPSPPLLQDLAPRTGNRTHRTRQNPLRLHLRHRPHHRPAASALGSLPLLLPPLLLLLCWVRQEERTEHALKELQKELLNQQPK